MSGEKVKLSKDGSSIDFTASESIPTSMKKFRQSPEIEGFYRFIYENDLQKEALEILEKIILQRKAAKKSAKDSAKETAKAAKAAAVSPAPAPVKPAKAAVKAPPAKTASSKSAPATKAKGAAKAASAKGKPKKK
ncbi:MAG: hypothetical protein AB7H97_16150 [Pseudobdellovibrionaceae bacterium]